MHLLDVLMLGVLQVWHIYPRRRLAIGEGCGSTQEAASVLHCQALISMLQTESAGLGDERLYRPV